MSVTASELASGSLIAALPSVTAVAISLRGSLWIVVRRPGLGMIFFFVLFAFAWRLVSVLYIDLSGPLFSDQLVRESVLVMGCRSGRDFAGACGHRVAVFVPTRAVRRLIDADGLGFASRLPPGGFRSPNLAFWAAALFVAALVGGIVVRGPIPLVCGHRAVRLYAAVWRPVASPPAGMGTNAGVPAWDILCNSLAA